MNFIHSILYYFYILRVRAVFDKNLVHALAAIFDRYINVTDRLNSNDKVEAYKRLREELAACVTAETLKEKCRAAVKILPFEYTITCALLDLSAVPDGNFETLDRTVGDIAFALHHIY